MLYHQLGQTKDKEMEQERLGNIRRLGQANGIPTFPSYIPPSHEVSVD